MTAAGSASKVDHKSASESDATTQGLQLSLSTAKEEILLLQDQLDVMKSERDIAGQEFGTLKEEHEQIRSKFMKLRDALFQEREKAEKAEDRAEKAETSAGKGIYNQGTTRVLHLQNNPLSFAIREKYENEIKELKSELSEMTSGHQGLVPMAISKSSDPALDAEKFSKRLKDQFRNHIALFREGVHIITGKRPQQEWK
jgi:chromosome segregation ATPase